MEHIREALLEIPQLREQLQEMTRELETLRVQFEVLGGLPPASQPPRRRQGTLMSPSSLLPA